MAYVTVRPICIFDSGQKIKYDAITFRKHAPVDSSSRCCRSFIFAFACVSRRNEQRGRVGRMMHKLIEQVSMGKHEAWRVWVDGATGHLSIESFCYGDIVSNKSGQRRITVSFVFRVRFGEYDPFLGKLSTPCLLRSTSDGQHHIEHVTANVCDESWVKF